MNGIFELSGSSFDKVKLVTKQNVKTELQPVLKKSERFDLEDAKTIVINMLNSLLTLTDNEKQYLIEFSKDNYNPSLLFDESIASKVKSHPMALWRLTNIKK